MRSLGFCLDRRRGLVLGERCTDVLVFTQTFRFFPPCSIISDSTLRLGSSTSYQPPARVVVYQTPPSTSYAPPEKSCMIKCEANSPLYYHSKTLFRYYSSASESPFPSSTQTYLATATYAISDLPTHPCPSRHWATHAPRHTHLHLLAHLPYSQD
jgi:hypothetical protein